MSDKKPFNGVEVVLYDTPKEAALNAVSEMVRINKLKLLEGCIPGEKMEIAILHATKQPQAAQVGATHDASYVYEPIHTETVTCPSVPAAHKPNTQVKRENSR